MEKVATDIYTFSRLREEGFTYVDKTAALYAMASGEVGFQFFIARPRRFGKSLAVSTLKALFEGRRDLFQGLAIEPMWDWTKKWPVLHLDMGSVQARNVDEFRELLCLQLKRRAAEALRPADGMPATSLASRREARRAGRASRASARQSAR